MSIQLLIALIVFGIMCVVIAGAFRSALRLGFLFSLLLLGIVSIAGSLIAALVMGLL